MLEGRGRNHLKRNGWRFTWGVFFVLKTCGSKKEVGCNYMDRSRIIVY